MKINVFTTWQEAQIAFNDTTFPLAHSVVLVIDVLRASTTSTNALENGCTSIQMVVDIDAARSLKKSNANALLCGERNGLKITGFDLGNSPLEYSREMISGKSLIFSSTNGSKAMALCHKAKQSYLLCFRNKKALVQELVRKHKKEGISNLILLCSGTNGLFSLDDFLCAGWFIKDFHRSLFSDGGLPQAILNDAASAAFHLTEDEEQATILLQKALHYQSLKDLGFDDDLDFCYAQDTTNIIPLYDKKSKLIISS